MLPFERRFQNQQGRNSPHSQNFPTRDFQFGKSSLTRLVDRNPSSDHRQPGQSDLHKFPSPFNKNVPSMNISHLPFGTTTTPIKFTESQIRQPYHGSHNYNVIGSKKTNLQDRFELLSDYSTSKPQINQTVTRGQLNPDLNLVHRQGDTSFSFRRDPYLFNKPNVANPNLRLRVPTEATLPPLSFDQRARDPRQMGDSHQPWNFKLGSEQQPVKTEDLQKATQNVSAKIENQLSAAEDPILNDISKQVIGVGPHDEYRVEYVPLQIIPTQQLLLPPQIFQAIKMSENPPVAEFSKCNKHLLIAVRNTLFVWDYSNQSQNRLFASDQKRNLHPQQSQHGNPIIGIHNFNSSITSLEELSSANMSTGWVSEGFAVKNSLHLIVATLQEIKVLLITRENNTGISIQDSMIPAIPLSEGSHVTAFAEFKKLGRVFYGTSDGHVREIYFNNYKNTVMSLFSNDPVKMKINYRQGGVLSKISNFVFRSNQKAVRQLVVDEQRNLLYCLKEVLEGREMDHTTIEVFELGYIGEQFQSMLTISSLQLLAKIDEFNGRKNEKYENKYDQAKLYTVQAIHPVTYSESQIIQLEVVTHRGSRIFIHLTKEEEQREFLNTEIEKFGLQSDELIKARLKGDWMIVNILSDMPDENHVVQDEAYAQNVFENTFSIHYLPPTQRFLHNRNPLVNFSFKDPLKSTLVYQMNDGLTWEQKRIYEEQDGIKLSFIQKNHPTFQLTKNIFAEEGEDKSSINDVFSVVQIRKIQEHPYEANRQINSKSICHFREELPEQIVKVSNFRSGASSDTLVMLGHLKQRNEKAAVGKHNLQRPYFPYSMHDQQIYIQSEQMNLLTNNRFIQLKQIRPIDHLYMIVNELSKGPNKFYSFDVELKQFCQFYSIQEVCAMLIQMLSDNNAVYNFSTRMQQIFDLKRSERRFELYRYHQHERLPHDNQSAAYRGQSYQGSRSHTKIQQGVASQSQIRQPFLASRERVSNFVTRHSSTPQRGFYGQLSKTRVEQEPANFDELNQKSYLLNHFDLNQGEQTLLAKPMTTEIYKTAIELLNSYGDTVNAQNQGLFESHEAEKLDLEKFEDEAVHLQIYPEKHKALYVVLMRILQPIWRMPITNRPSFNAFYSQRSNIDLILPAREKLEGLYKLLTSKTFEQMNRTYNDRKLISEDCQLLYDCIQVCKLNKRQQDFLEVAQKESLNQLKLYLRKCLDVIEFLFQINCTAEDFSALIKQLDPISVKRLAELQFKDLVNQESSPLIQQLLELTIRVDSNGDSKQTSDLIRTRARQVQETCQTLFPQGESHIIVGISHLQTALQEHDPVKKGELIKQGMQQMADYPSRINIDQVVPLFVKNGNLLALVEICLLKAKSLDPLKDMEQIEDIYTTVCALYEAIDQAIKKEKSTSLSNSKFFPLFVEYLGKRLDGFNQLDELLNLQKNVIQLLKQRHEEKLIGFIFKCFLIAERQTEFIWSEMQRTQIIDQVQEFVNQSAQGERLTMTQFDSIVRILSKNRLVEKLADLVIKVIFNNISLYERSQNKELKLYRLSCDDKNKLAQDTLIKLEDFLNLDTDYKDRHGQNQQIMKDQVDQEQEKLYRQLQLLQQTIKGLKDQKQILSCVDSKISYMQKYADQLPSTKATEKDKEMDAVQDLKLFKEELEFTVLDKMQKQSKLKEYDIKDGLCYAYLHLYQVETAQDQRKFNHRVEKALDELATELIKYHASDPQALKQIAQKKAIYIFKPRRGEEEMTTFKKQERERHLLQWLNKIAEQVDELRLKVDLIEQGYTWWLHDVIFQDLGIAPSSVIDFYLTDQEKIKKGHNVELGFRILSVIRQWSKMVDKSYSEQQTSLVKSSKEAEVVVDFKTNSVRIYKHVFDDVLSEIASVDFIEIDKNVQTIFRRIFDKAKSDFESKISQLIPEQSDQFIRKIRVNRSRAEAYSFGISEQFPSNRTNTAQIIVTRGSQNVEKQDEQPQRPQPTASAADEHLLTPGKLEQKTFRLQRSFDPEIGRTTGTNPTYQPMQRNIQNQYSLGASKQSLKQMREASQSDRKID